MKDRAVIQNVSGTWTLVSTHEGEKGFVRNASGKKLASPIIIGWEEGDVKVVPYSVETVDNSTSSLTDEATSMIVDSSQVVNRTTVNDMSLASARADLKSRIQNLFDKKVAEPLEVNGITVRRDGKRMAQIIGADLNPNPNRKRVIEGEPVAAGASTISAIMSAISANEDTNGENAYNLATAVNNAATLGELEAIDINSGWA